MTDPVHAAAVPAGSVPVPKDERREFFDQYEKAYAEIGYGSALLFALAACHDLGSFGQMAPCLE